MAMVTYNDISVDSCTWGFLCSCIKNGEYIKMRYAYGYTRKQAIKAFHAYVNGKGC